MDGSVKYLWSAATKLPNSSVSLQLLKAHYAEKSFAIAKRSCEFPENLRDVSSMCPKCSSFWSNGALNLRIKSPTKDTKRRTRNFVIKHYRDKKNIKLRRLSRKLALINFKSAEFTCRICGEITKIPMLKLASKKVSVDEKKIGNISQKSCHLPPQVSPTISKRKKKKKKKDQFAGLNKDAILAIKTMKLENVPKKPAQGPSIGKLASILKQKASISGNKLHTMLK
ncbi:uncharacterized protein LOC129788525 [Lutzomyia longipalpis]|uniref:uncharacterized protein LOC129788525 n=1 Tax=Lutzomyia longipalpis TaxID=7200 RepID=UPI0024838669|nr:uncharacterized protein LOC129788525 [Lutzomyia longipalpis]